MLIANIDGIGSETAQKLNTLGINSTDDIRDIKDILNIKYLGTKQAHKILQAKGLPLSEQEVDFLRSQMVVNQVQKTKFTKPKSQLKQKVKIVAKKKFIPSSYQQAIYDTIDDPNNIIVEAVAGSGKTTTVVDFVDYIPRNLSVVFLAFNTHIKQELESKLPNYVDVYTVHSFGNAVLKENGFKLKVEPNKLYDVYDKEITQKDRYKLSNEDYESMKPSVVKIINFIKNTQARTERADIEYIMNRFSIEMPECVDDSISFENYIKMIKLVFDLSVEKYKKVIDFQDMNYFPVIKNLIGKQYDYVLVDEAQDLNKTQLELIANSLKPETGKLIAIGDSRQSLYSFRGADSDSMQNIKDRFNCREMPLSITYRCPKLHVDYVKQYVPQIEASTTAKQGEIINIEDGDFVNIVKANDLVICRYNAPLVSPCLKLIAQGKKAKIVGTDFEEQLMNLIKKFKPKTIAELSKKLDKWYDKEIARLEKLGANTQQTNDKYECVRQLINMSNAKTVAEIKRYIRDIFKEGKPEISLSTVHRAKGLEAENVFIYYPNLMPSIYAKQNWELQQEENIMYVAYTRSLNKIYNVMPTDY